MSEKGNPRFLNPRLKPMKVAAVFLGVVTWATAASAFLPPPSLIATTPSRTITFGRRRGGVEVHEGDHPAPVVDTISDSADASEVSSVNTMANVRNFLRAKFTKKNLSTMGMSLFLSYGFVSNINSAAMMGWIWAKYVKDTGLSPFIGWQPPFVTPKFLAYYGAIYITLGSLLRPVRAAIATGLSPVFNRVIEGLQSKFKFNKATAVFTVIFMGNVVFTCAWLLFNLRVACWAFGVPLTLPVV